MNDAIGVNYEMIDKAYMILPLATSLYSEMSTTVELEDEGAGLFVVVIQAGREQGKIALTSEEWPLVRGAIEALLIECEKRNRKG